MDAVSLFTTTVGSVGGASALVTFISVFFCVASKVVGACALVALIWVLCTLRTQNLTDQMHLYYFVLTDEGEFKDNVRHGKGAMYYAAEHTNIHSSNTNTATNATNETNDTTNGGNATDVTNDASPEKKPLVPGGRARGRLKYDGEWSAGKMHGDGLNKFCTSCKCRHAIRHFVLRLLRSAIVAMRYAISCCS
jgi:hypothetical protein